MEAILAASGRKNALIGTIEYHVTGKVLAAPHTTPEALELNRMLAEGKSVKEIATGFDLSVKTVEAHKFNLMRKLDIHNKAQLVQYAIQKKIIRLMEPLESVAV